MSKIALRGFLYTAATFLGGGAAMAFAPDPFWKSVLTLIVAGIMVVVAYLDKTVANNSK